MKNNKNTDAQQPGAFEKTAIDIVHRGGPEPGTDRGPGAWDHFAGGVRGGLADFVSRVLHGQPSPTPEPDRNPDKGIDR